LAKKQKKATTKRAPSKHQLSKWQRQTKMRRIVIITAAVFLAGILGWVGYESYKDYESNPAHEVMFEVNGVRLTMEYYLKILDAYTAGMNYTDVYQYGDYIADSAANDIINNELLKQGAKNLGIEVTPEEIDASLQQYGLPDNEAYRDIIEGVLLEQKLKEEYFGTRLNATMKQAHVQVMLAENQEVADEVITKVEAGGNFTALAEEFSCSSLIEGDLGWLPEELMPNTLIANAAFNDTVGDISQPIYDETATKDVGYWLIEVTGAQNETINAQVMLLGSEAEAEQVKAELAAGGNFSALALNYSQHESKTNGGKLDGLKRGDIGSEVFDQVAFNLTINEVSQPVRDTSVHTTGGYWLVDVVDRGDHELSDSVKQQLADNDYSSWLQDWTDQSTVETYLDADKKQWAISQVLAGM
jgi:parvulin-like peptidyl-prolyl isomerase